MTEDLEDLNVTEYSNDSLLEHCNMTETFIEQWTISEKVFWTISDFLSTFYYIVFIELIRKNSETML